MDNTLNQAISAELFTIPFDDKWLEVDQVVVL
jgi:hypothetical protein